MKRATGYLGSVLLAIALAGCQNAKMAGAGGNPGQNANLPGAVGNLGQNANIPGAAGNPGQATAPFKLSKLDQASYADVVVGPDKTIHVIYGEEPRNDSSHWQVFYRASNDGGATWSDPKNLTEVDPTRQAGYMRLAIDGQGRVYAFWKAIVHDEIVPESVGSGDTAGTLVYRVLDHGAWSDLATIGTPESVYAWFPSASPNGRCYVVWNEDTIIRPNNGGDPVHAGKAEIFQAELAGATVGNALQLVHGKPGTTDAFKVDSYDSLRGYVDAAGQAHFSAVKLPIEHQFDPDIVYWNGTEKTLFPLAQATASYNPSLNSTPQLLPGADGQDHLIYWDQKADHPAVVDHPLAGQPVTLFQTTDPKGEVQHFEAYAAPNGQMIALIGAVDVPGADATADLYLVSTQGGQWGKPVNLTFNASRASSSAVKPDGLNGSYLGAQTIYKPLYAAAAADADGHIDLMMIDDAVSNSSGVSGLTEGFSNHTEETNAFFVRR